eukprot:84132_1
MPCTWFNVLIQRNNVFAVLSLNTTNSVYFCVFSSQYLSSNSFPFITKSFHFVLIFIYAKHPLWMRQILQLHLLRHFCSLSCQSAPRTSSCTPLLVRICVQTSSLRCY